MTIESETAGPEDSDVVAGYLELIHVLGLESFDCTLDQRPTASTGPAFLDQKIVGYTESMQAARNSTRSFIKTLRRTKALSCDCRGNGQSVFHSMMQFAYNNFLQFRCNVVGMSIDARFCQQFL